MSFEAYAITGKIGLDESPAVKSCNNTVGAAKSMALEFKTSAANISVVAGGMGKTVEASAAKSAANATASYKKYLSEVGSELGKKSALGLTMKLAMGGGAIAGLSMVSNELNNITRQMLEIGKIHDPGERLEKVMGVLPVVGPAWQAGRNIREMITGEGEAAERTATQLDKWRQSLQDGVDAHRAAASSLREGSQMFETDKRLVNQQIGILFKTGQDRAFAETENRRVNGLAAVQDKSRVMFTDAEKNELSEKSGMLPRLRAQLKEAQKAQATMDSQLVDARKKVEENIMPGEIKDSPDKFLPAGVTEEGIFNQRAKITQLEGTLSTIENRVKDLTAKAAQASGYSKTMTAKNNALAVGENIKTWLYQPFGNIGERLKKAWSGFGFGGDPRPAFRAANLQIMGMQDESAFHGLDSYDRKIIEFKRAMTTPGQITAYEKAARLAQSLFYQQSEENPGEKYTRELGDATRITGNGGMSNDTFARMSFRSQMDYFGDMDRAFASQRQDAPALVGNRHFETLSTNNNTPTAQMQKLIDTAVRQLKIADEALGVDKQIRDKAQQSVLQPVTIGG